MRFRGLASDWQAALSVAVQTARRPGLALATIGLATAFLFPNDAQSQQQRPPRVTHLEVDNGPPVPLQRNSGFRLFAEEDIAASGMNMTGTFGWFFNNIGPCPWYFTIDIEVCGFTRRQNGTLAQPYFEINFVAGAPIHEFRKIRAVHPGVSTMRPPIGYTAPYSFYLATPQRRGWGAADGQFGNLFSGVAGSEDGSCTDDSSILNGRVPTSITRLASSDCPVTWPTAGFLGKRPVTDQGWLAAFQADPANFTWNDWQLPPSAFDTTQFLGNFSTYGAVSDSYRERIQAYGGVTRLGSGAPSERGYPLGLHIRFDAFQFSRPSVRNAVWYQLTMVNESERLYGTGIDYDSLYFGLEPGILIGGPQGTSWYHDFERNTVVMARGNLSGNCSPTLPRRATGAGGCASLDGPTNILIGISLFKSPLGDARNRVFSDPTSLFYNPTSEFADDTITWNHARRGGFGFTYNTSFVRNDRALFGYLSSTENNFFDQLSFTDFTLAQLFTFFQNENFQGVIDPNIARFNKFVPGSTPGFGSWDYNNDGIQDTISVPTCGQFGCVGIYSDTIAGGLQNFISNVGNIISSGPFALAAGDTTQFIYVFTGAADSSSFESLINSSLATYLGNYAGPSAFPPPVFTDADVEVTSAEVRDSLLGVQNAQVRIRIDQPPPLDDAFIARVVEILQDTTNAAAQRLVALNPDLIRAVQSRIRVNYSRLLIFKSCDNGITFTVSADCTPAPAENIEGNDIGFGWQAFAIINVDSVTKRLSSSFFTDNVMAGRTYLYTFVTQTRGFVDIAVIDSINTPSGPALGSTNLRDALSLDADTISSALFRSGPSTVKVYAPITLPAGRQFAALDTSTISGLGTARITTTARGSIQPGTYTIFFANRFIVTTAEDTVSGDITQTVVAQRVLKRASTSTDPAGGAPLVAQADTFTGTGLLITAAAIPSNRVGASGSVVTYIDTLVAPSLGYILAGGAAGATTPFFLATSLVNPGSTFEEDARFPGFLFNFAAEGSPRLSVTIRAEGDTLNAGVVNANGVTYLGASSTFLGDGGLFELDWRSDAFGPQSPFTFGTAAELQPTFTASLTARPVAQTGSTDPAVEALLPTSTRPLIPVKVPFTITGPFGDQAVIAMRQRHTSSADSALLNSILIGTAGDTTRLAVPPDVWVPGDQLFVLSQVQRDSVVGSGATATVVVRDTTIGGRPATVPIQVRSLALSFSPMVLGCTTNSVPSRLTCNPLALGTRAATGYLPYQPGWTTALEFTRGFDLFSELQLQATATVTGGPTLTEAELNRVHVVPNPYVVQSLYDNVDAARVGTSQIRFVNVPSQGSLRIYTVSGQLVQQLTWTEADLIAAGEGRIHGDLPYNLRSREGLELGTGLYVYVLTPTGANANGAVARGKFVIIR